MQIKPEDHSIINDLIHWKERQQVGYWITRPQEKPKLHDSFLRLEQLGIAILMEIRHDSFIWRVDYNKAKETAKELAKSNDETK